MKSTTGCPLEEQILAALTGDGVTASAQQHLLECSTCRNMVEVDAWMQEFSRQPLEERALPDATLIWLRSQLLEQGGALSQLRRSAGVLQTAGFGLVAFAWALVISWKWSVLAAFFSHAGVTVLSSALGAQGLSVRFLVTLVALLCATIGVAFQAAMADQM